MKRLLQLVVCLSLISSAAFAGRGGIGEKIFFQIGGTVGADVMHMEGTFANEKGARGIKEITFVSNNVNLATLQFNARINFLELSNNSALSLSFRPSGSFGRAINDIGGTSTMIRLPLTLDLNSGAAATVSTRAKTGFTLGVGAEFVKYPLAGEGVALCRDENSARDGDYISLNASWIQPVVTLGIRFFGKHYYCREINFKACYKSPGDVDNKCNESAQSLYSTIKDFQNVGLMISFMQYLNY